MPDAAPPSITTIAATVVVGSFTASQTFPVAAGYGSISGVPSGDGNLTLDALDATGATLYTGSSTFSGQGGQAFSVTVTMAPAPGALVPPWPPNDLTAKGTPGQVTLTWSTVNGADSYRLYWSNTAGVTPKTGNRFLGVTSPFVHTGIPEGVGYYYVLTAVNAAGESAPSPQVGPIPRVVLSNGQAAAVIFGTSGGPTGARPLYQPGGNSAVNDGILYLADQGNNRVLGYNPVPTISGVSADFALGQPDMTSHGFGSASTSLCQPTGVSIFGGKLFVADSCNSRVLIWNTVPTTTGAAADVVLGQSDFGLSTPGACDKYSLNMPYNVYAVGGRLLVADSYHSRVLIWNSIPTVSGTAADMALGQPNLTTCSVGLTASKLRQPFGVWSDGTRVMVADMASNRVLIWNSFPTSSGQAADVVLGQADFTSDTAVTSQSGMNQPFGVTSNGQQLAVADSTNSRVLIWNAIPTVNGANADVVLGQLDFTSSTPPFVPSARMHGPQGVLFNGNSLIAIDTHNNRVLIFQGQ